MSYSQADNILGQTVINSFLQNYKKYNSVEISQTDLLNKILVSGMNQNNYLAILGYSFKIGINSDFTVLDERMDRLAKETSGGLPSSTSIIDVMKDETSIITIISNAVSDSAVQVGSGVQTFGENSLFLLSTLNTLFPFLVIGGLAYFIFVNRGKFKLN